MANYYTLFSEVIEDLTPEEETWLASVLYIDPDEMSELELQDWTDNGYDGICPDSDPLYWPEFSFNLSGKQQELWIYAEESGNLENVFAVVQRFLEKFRPDDYFSIQWSYTCSKPRTDAFGGGAAFITALDIKTMNTDRWLNEQVKPIEEKH